MFMHGMPWYQAYAGAWRHLGAAGWQSGFEDACAGCLLLNDEFNCALLKMLVHTCKSDLLLRDYTWQLMASLQTSGVAC